MPESTAITAERHAAWSSELSVPNRREIGVNTSGTQGLMPVEVAELKWHWGAAGLAPFWLFRHNYKALALALVAFTCIAPFIPGGGPPVLYLVSCVHMAASLWLGQMGYRLAWHRRRFESIEQFRNVQRAWSLCSIGFTLMSGAFLLFLAVVYLIVARAMNAA